MATLESLLTPTAGDADLEPLRGYIRQQMAETRAALISADAERAFWQDAAIVDDRPVMAEERATKGRLQEQVIQNLLAKYNALEARFSSLPAADSEACAG
jgi:hypothetical protein